MLQLHPLVHSEAAIAAKIHALQMAAYAQEAALLGITTFPPLQRTAKDVLQSSESFLGAFEDHTLVGALGTQPDETDDSIQITSLVVHPKHQRKGIGRRLLQASIKQHASCAMTVQTAAANAPALHLYAEFQFTIHRHWSVGYPPLTLVQLRRAHPGTLAP